jgi:hypothetical protein
MFSLNIIILSLLCCLIVTPGKKSFVLAYDSGVFPDVSITHDLHVSEATYS